MKLRLFPLISEVWETAIASLRVPEVTQTYWGIAIIACGSTHSFKSPQLVMLPLKLI